MIEILRSIFVGGIQGISEFLPISSSGHLVLIPYILKWNYQGLSFDIALHFGTTIAIVVYFWKDWEMIILQALRELSFRPRKAVGEISSKDSSTQLRMTIGGKAVKYPGNLLWQILVASIPAAILGIFLEDYVEKYLHSPLLIAFNLIFFGVVLWIVDKRSRSTYNLKLTSYKQSFFIGCAQALALFPGVSRSGITMTAGRSLGLDKKSSARFSFLLATPAILGAFLLNASDIKNNDLNLFFLSGVISSTIFGFFAIKYLLKYLERGNFSIFVWYRVLLAIVVLYFYYAR